MTNSQKVISAIQAQYGTQALGQFEVVRQQYYDFVRLPVAGTNKLTFFSNPIGAVDPVSGLTKTLEETNIRRSGELDERFVITQIKTRAYILPIQRQLSGVQAVTNAVVSALTPVHQAIENLAMQAVLSINFGQKNYIQIEQPLQKCPPGYGVSIRSIGATDTGAGTFEPLSQYTTHSIDPRDVYVIDPVMFIEKGQTFNASFDYYLANSVTIPTVGGANVAVNVGVILDGYVIRPVQ